jgi:hypothetical protein
MKMKKFHQIIVATTGFRTHTFLGSSNTAIQKSTIASDMSILLLMQVEWPRHSSSG